MIIRAMPLTNDTLCLCFFPYIKKPNPIDPNTKLIIIYDVLIEPMLISSSQKSIVFHFVF